MRIVAAFLKKVLDPATRHDGNGTASLRKLRLQDRVKSPVATRYVVESDSE